MTFTAHLNIERLPNFLPYIWDKDTGADTGTQDAGEAINDIVDVLAAFAQLTVTSTVTADPSSPAAGAMHRVIATATGLFTGQEDDIAIFLGDRWVFKTPDEGWFLWDNTANLRYRFDGTNWVVFAAAAAVNYTDNTGGTATTSLGLVSDNADSTDNTQINDNFASLNKRINDLEALFETAKLLLP